MPKVFEICAGGGGQAIGLEAAGFETAAVAEIDAHACATLRLNRPNWDVIEGDVRTLDATTYRGTIDLFAGGVPCPPFSIAGKQLGNADERDLFPEALRLISQMQPRAVMLENVPGFASERFRKYRSSLLAKFRKLGYLADWRILNACDFNVAQLRPRFILVAFRPEDFSAFRWPEGGESRVSVGDAVSDLMAGNGWPGVPAWRKRANGVAPTIVGGSKKHGGPDLGPTRARKQWAELGVNGLGIADEPPPANFPKDENPKLTVRMVARIQGFPDSWQFAGRKTAAYRQVGNAFPPPVAAAVGRAILDVFAGIRVSTRPGEQAGLFEGLAQSAML
jgi:DNA (cytosine-5)-methyltransferase 1